MLFYTHSHPQLSCINFSYYVRERKINSGKDTRLVVDRSVKGDDGFTDEERDNRVQEV